MAVVEDIELRVTVNGLQAQRALDETRASAEKMGGGLSRVVGSLEGVQKSAQALQQKLGPAAAAISGVSSALGQTGGEAAKVIAGVGQLAAAFGAGGPLGVALVATSLAVDSITTTMKEAAEAENVWRQTLVQTSPQMARTADLVRSLADEAKRYAAEIANAGKTQYEVQIAAAAAEKAQLEARVENIEKSERLRQLAVNRAQSELESARARGDVSGMEGAQERLDVALSVQQEVRENAVTYRAQIASIEDSVWKIADAWQATAKASKEATGGRAATAAGDVGGLLAKERGERLKMLQDFAAEAERQRAEQARAAADAAEESVRAEIADREKWDAYELELAQRKEDERLRIEKDAAAERKRIREQEIVDAQATYGALVTSAAQALGTFVAESAAGQEAALQNLLKAASQQAGGFIMLQGGQLIAEGIRNSFAIATAPLGAAQIAGGAGLVAAGTAVQVGGPLAISALMGQAGASGAAGRTSGGGDPGARARAPRTMPGEGGGTNLTIVYGGLSGPTADDGARALKKAERRAARRGYK